MASCPKCGHTLRLTDWKQNCKYCGANIVVYDLQERLMKDADIAEVQNYRFRRKIDRVKGSFVGSKLAIARIFTSLLPLGAVFLPIVSLSTENEKLAAIAGKPSILDIVNGFDKIDLGALFDFSSKPGVILSLAAGFFALSLLALLVRFILLTLACSPKGKIRNIIMDAVLFVTTVGAAILYCSNRGGAVSGSLGVGGILYIVLQLVNIGVDLATLKQGIKITHSQCYVGGIPIEEYFELKNAGTPLEEIRKEQYKRLSAIRLQQLEKLKEDEKKKEEGLASVIQTAGKDGRQKKAKKKKTGKKKTQYKPVAHKNPRKKSAGKKGGTKKVPKKRKNAKGGGK